MEEVMAGWLPLSFHREKLVALGLLVPAIAELQEVSIASSFSAYHTAQQYSKYVFSLVVAFR